MKKLSERFMYYCGLLAAHSANQYSLIDDLKHIQDLIDAEEQGLLLKLPCKVGNTVYKPNPITLSEVVEINIESFFITESTVNISGRTTKRKYSFCCSPDDFGKTVFLTKEEAEQALHRLQEDKQ